jgi:hypothetical protein
MATAVGLVKDKPIELITDIPEQLPFVQGDNIRIRQVLLNLVSNAAKFTEQGHIGVSARTIRRGNRSEVVIAVFDTGPGIDQADQERIFEPFSQVDASPTRKTGGTGLGLSISRHLVELHGGVIWVESIPGEGSTFAFTLPFDPELQFTRSSTPIIMGIDHDPPALLQYRESLEAKGYRFHSLSRPDQATEVLRTLQPQAVVIDLLEEDMLLWKLLADLAAEIAQNPIPLLITELFEAKDHGLILPIQFWLPSSASEEMICASFACLPSSSAKPTVLAIEPEMENWARLRDAVESQDCAQLEQIESLDELKSRLDDGDPDGILIDLRSPDDFVYAIIAYLGEIGSALKFPALGILPESINEDNLAALQEITSSFKDNSYREREEHLHSLVQIITELLPHDV